MQIKTKIIDGVTPQQFKDVVANFATGITLVTTSNAQGGPAGLLVNSLSSVSLDPPLILFCLAKTSQLHPIFGAIDQFAVNLLNTEQEWLVKQFTSAQTDRWAGVDYVMSRDTPIIATSLAHIECDVVARHDAGDHTIYVGQAVNMSQGEGKPLLYYNRQFGEFTPAL